MPGPSIDSPTFTRYPLYAELTETLRQWAATYPRWCELTEIGQSADGRALHLMTVGDRESARLGGVASRPAIWVDGNHHAGEVIGSVVALATIWSLIERAEQGERHLEETTWYVQPRVAVDGAEVYLTTPHRLRSAAIDYPRTTPASGLHPADLDGDGWITQMRVPDEYGEWRVSDRDRRLMVRRSDEDASDGAYYRLYPESECIGEGAAPQVAPVRWGLDFNRSYPHNWQPEYRQSGAGPYPLFPPETRANVDFILSHPNIGLVVSYHTFGGFAFRLPSSAPVSAYRHGDLTGDYARLCERFTEMTGGPVIQSYDDATATARFGSLMDWAYNQHGIYGWVPELWDAWLAAGIDRRDDPESFHAPRDEDEQAALLAWNDRDLGGSGFVDWHPFEHPQLGPVEIGGWTYKYTHQNPPGERIPEIATAHIRWTDHLAAALPRLDVANVEIEDLGSDLYRVTALIANESFLPTNVSQQAIDVRRAQPVLARIELSAGDIVDGNERDLGHLAGRGGSTHRIWEDPRPVRNTVTATWVVRGRPVGKIVARSAKAGYVERAIDATT
jgi:murein tripeptide amidase MpaA